MLEYGKSGRAKRRSQVFPLNFLLPMFTDRSMLPSERVNPAAVSDKYRHPQSKWMELWEFYEKTGGSISGPEGDRNSTGRPAESTNLELWGAKRLIYQIRTNVGCT